MWKEKLSKNFKFVPKQQSSSSNGRGDRTIQVLIKIKKRKRVYPRSWIVSIG
jgi:hypothetical protein